MILMDPFQLPWFCDLGNALNYACVINKALGILSAGTKLRKIGPRNSKLYTCSHFTEKWLHVYWWGRKIAPFLCRAVSFVCLLLPKGSAAWLSQICNGEPMCTAKASRDQLQIPHLLNTTGLCSLQCCTTRYEFRNSFWSPWFSCINWDIAPSLGEQPEGRL